MQLAVRQINDAGGVGRSMLDLVFEDTQGLPAAGLDAVDRLARQGVDVLAGEYHSMVANAVLAEVDRLRLPFVCASATLDAITARRLSRVFRIAPPQSYGWRAYASYLVATGMSRVFAVIEHSTYWEAAGADGSGIPFLAYERPGRLTARGERAARDFATAYGREPSFVALEGYDAIVVLDVGVRAAGSVDPAALCHALRHTAIQGTRGTIAFSTEPAGVVHQQWKWAPTCVVAFRAGRQRFSSSELLWDAERSSPRPMESG